MISTSPPPADQTSPRAVSLALQLSTRICCAGLIKLKRSNSPPIARAAMTRRPSTIGCSTTITRNRRRKHDTCRYR